MFRIWDINVYILGILLSVYLLNWMENDIQLFKDVIYGLFNGKREFN